MSGTSSLEIKNVFPKALYLSKQARTHNCQELARRGPAVSKPRPQLIRRSPACREAIGLSRMQLKLISSPQGRGASRKKHTQLLSDCRHAARMKNILFFPSFFLFLEREKIRMEGGVELPQWMVSS
ncbi:hypothetical protein NPIL_583461 [Nephila pilipes]|uniref:Uncharacterized protein n=1 Tax=Nephila pilipes TaxID=299642 RepID=A0A8X6QD26_NEPPI|nr:hypothetical protein NPIL_583461 [Nephila pilipes]